MLIVQVLASFAVWIVIGWLLARRAGKFRGAFEKLGRPLRIAFGPLLMLLGAGALLGGVALVAAVHGLAPGSLTPLGWAIVTVVGIVFVAAQAVASLVMVSLATESEAPGISQTSDRRINK